DIPYAVAIQDAWESTTIALTAGACGITAIGFQSAPRRPSRTSRVRRKLADYPELLGDMFRAAHPSEKPEISPATRNRLE
ncbi:MAG: hypothetical protein J2P17_18375, partial [Mycobacterium sp.]|nr:hypothetical protein [Mycobacterium sp.]